MGKSLWFGYFEKKIAGLTGQVSSLGQRFFFDSVRENILAKITESFIILREWQIKFLIPKFINDVKLMWELCIIDVWINNAQILHQFWNFGIFINLKYCGILLSISTTFPTEFTDWISDREHSSLANYSYLLYILSEFKVKTLLALSFNLKFNVKCMWNFFFLLHPMYTIIYLQKQNANK